MITETCFAFLNTLLVANQSVSVSSEYIYIGDILYFWATEVAHSMVEVKGGIDVDGDDDWVKISMKYN